MKKAFLILLFILCSQSLAWAQPAAGQAAAKPYVKPVSLTLAGAQVQLGLEVWAPEQAVTAVRLDNVGGETSLWRSDGQDSQALPLPVQQGGTLLTDGTTAMALKLPGEPQRLDLNFADNGAFCGNQTEFRVTVFLANGNRLLCLLNPKDFQPQGTVWVCPSGGGGKPTPPPVPVTPAPVQPGGDGGKTSGTVQNYDDADPDDWAYTSFRMVMDKASGKNSTWSDQGHSFNDPVLTVRGVTMAGTGSAPSGEMAEVQVTSIMRPEVMKEFLASGFGEKSAPVAGQVLVKAMKLYDQPGQPQTIGQMSLPSLLLRGLTTAGHIEELTVENFEGQRQDSPNAAPMHAKLGTFRLREAVVAGQLAGQFKELAFEGLEFQQPDTSGAAPMTAKMASFLMRDASPEGRVAELTIKDADISLPKGPDGAPLTGKMESIEVVNLDFRELLAETRASAGSRSGRRLAEAFMKNFVSMDTLGELFVSSYSLDKGSIKNLEASSGGMAIKLAEGRIDGPVTAGHIVPKMVVAFTGLEAALPANPADAAAMGLPVNVVQMAQVLGLTTLALDIEITNQYDEKTGVLTREISKFNARDLFDWSLKLQFSGLTPERLPLLQQTAMDDMLSAVQNPSSDLAQLALDEISFQFVDRSLFDRLYNSGIIPRTEASSMAQQVVVTYGDDFLTDAANIGQAVAAFLTDPGRLGFSLKPNPPLSVANAMSLGDLTKILNSLNAALTVNDKSSHPLVFKKAPSF
ncbi:MAG: hypothetical protein LBV79_11000 [Candidatus Adiutrix sp.]|nr:hypothetical protein [Candidatus Adiutrix sp.]